MTGKEEKQNGGRQSIITERGSVFGEYSKSVTVRYQDSDVDIRLPRSVSEQSAAIRDNQVQRIHQGSVAGRSEDIEAAL